MCLKDGDTLVFNIKGNKKEDAPYTERGKVIMCQKLNELSGLTPAKILEHYASEKPIYAVSMIDLINNLKIPVYEYDFSLSNPDMKELYEKSEFKDNIIGAIMLSEDDLYIFISDKSSEAEQRYILAHEIGHCCLHASTLREQKIEFAKDKDSDNTHEQEANNFAMELLMPEENIRLVYGKLINKSLNVMAELFCVPIECMRNRLNKLQLEYE